MFHSARLKLTIWYLLIIMLVSTLFSVAIYKRVTHELEIFARRQRFRIEERDLLPLRHFPNIFMPEDLDEVKNRVRVSLIFINLGIFLTAGAAGYFLAGKTLRPIEEMVSEQKRFIADASHELRTPLTSIKTSIEVGLRDKNMTINDAKQLLKSNLQDLNCLQKLSDNLIELAQYKKTNGALAFKKISLEEILASAKNKVLSLAKKKHIEINTNIEDYFFVGEFESLVELFTIFLDNAIKYSPAKSKIYLTSKKSNHDIVTTIKDEGIGIAKMDLPFIFDRFYRTDKSRSKETVKGFGLGLSIAKKIIDLHNGSVVVKSQLGGGTTFIIRLPVKQSKSFLN